MDGIDALALAAVTSRPQWQLHRRPRPGCHDRCRTYQHGRPASRKALMVFVGSNKDAVAMREIGASAFIYSSDDGLMRQAPAQVLAEFQAMV